MRARSQEIAKDDNVRTAETKAYLAATNKEKTDRANARKQKMIELEAKRKLEVRALRRRGSVSDRELDPRAGSARAIGAA